MAPIATYVFFDLETTGLPCEENNKTKITELSMVAVQREHIEDTPPGRTPRVLHKLTRCFNPGKRISDTSAQLTGLDNFLLEHENYFDATVFNMINSFLDTLSKPVCLIAHNGHDFDFPILKRQLNMLGVRLPDDVMCADSLHAFRGILERETEISASDTLETTLDEVDLTAGNCLSMKSVNETTPNQFKVFKRPHDFGTAKRKLPFSEKKLKKSYKLPDVYERVLGHPAVDTHRAETDCLLALKIAVALSKDFVSWVDTDTNHCSFSTVNPMTPGIKIGL